MTSKALFCSAMYFAEACGKSVTVGTMKCDDTEELGEQTLRVNCVNRKICVCVKQCRVNQCQSLKRQRRPVRRSIALVHIGGTMAEEIKTRFKLLGCIITGLALFAADRLRE